MSFKAIREIKILEKISEFTVFGLSDFVKVNSLGITVLDLGLISIESLGPRASTKGESHVNFTESQKVSRPNLFCNIKHREVS